MILAKTVAPEENSIPVGRLCRSDSQHNFPNLLSPVITVRNQLPKKKQLRLRKGMKRSFCFPLKFQISKHDKFLKNELTCPFKWSHVYRPRRQIGPKQLVIDGEKGLCLEFKVQADVKEINKYIFFYKKQLHVIFLVMVIKTLRMSRWMGKWIGCSLKQSPSPRHKANAFLPARTWIQIGSSTLTWWWGRTQAAAGEEGGGSGQHWKGLRSLCILTGNNINPELLSRSVDVLNTKA